MELTEEKAHATWSASATTRNWACAGALTLERLVAHLDRESEAAAWGTACHSVAEMCLTGGHDAEEFLERMIRTKEHEIEVDEELAETAQAYVDYVRGRQNGAIGLESGQCTLLIEQRFSLDKLKPPFDAGGTADAVIYFPAEKLLEVIDLKGGRGVKVEVTENKQLRTYALGAMLANPGLTVERIRSTIVQPRMQHKDGAIRSEEYHVIDLAEWAADLLAAMGRSKEAEIAYAAITGDISRELWAEKFLSPGDHCASTFCKARGICPALEKKALGAAGVWFDDESNPRLSNTPGDLDPERLEKMLDARSMVEDFFKACAQLAQALAESGASFPNYVLVEKTGRRRFKDKDDEKKLAAELFTKADLTADDIYADPKIKTPAQIEKLLGKRKNLIAELIETPVTGKSLVRKDKTTRKAVAPAVQQHFSVID